MVNRVGPAQLAASPDVRFTSNSVRISAADGIDAHNAAAEFTAASLFGYRGQSLEAMSGFGELRTRLGRMGRGCTDQPAVKTGAESKSRNAAISRRILVCCPFGEEAQAQHTPRGFRTIQVCPKDLPATLQ
jgi:hypothetical protein